MPTFLLRRLAAADTTGGDLPLSGLAQYGAAGLILSISLWFFWQVYKRERDRADANEAEIKRLNEVIAGKYVPALEASTAAVAEAARELARATARRRT